MIIYKLQNKINGKIYIGKTIKEVEQRIAEHLSTKSIIGNALRKYGLQSFDIFIMDLADDNEILNEKERYWIKTLNCKVPNGYNLTDGGDGLTNPLQETKDKISEKLRGKKLSFDHIEKLKGRVPWNKGKINVYSESTLEKIRLARKQQKVYGMMNKNHSKESNEKNRQTHSGMKQSLETINNMKLAQRKRREKEGLLKVSILCQCGCGNMTKPGSKFLQGHASKLKNPNLGKFKELHPMFGKHHSEEARINMKNAQIKRRLEITENNNINFIQPINSILQ